MKVLGAIIAGGKARRFGSDKACALFEGQRLIDRVADTLKAQTQGLVVCGREESGIVCIPDRPRPYLGPLGGINAALLYASTHGFDAVISTGCDIPNLPDNLAAQMIGMEAAIISDQPVVGFWPVDLAAALSRYLDEGNRRIYGFAKSVQAREITLEPPLLNINHPGDLKP